MKRRHTEPGESLDITGQSWAYCDPFDTAVGGNTLKTSADIDWSTAAACTKNYAPQTIDFPRKIVPRANDCDGVGTSQSAEPETTGTLSRRHRPASISQQTDIADQPCVSTTRIAYAASVGALAGSCGSRAAPCGSIQAAAAVAGPGGTVRVGCGQPFKTRTRLIHNITLLPDSDCEQVAVDASDQHPGFELFGTAQCVHIRGFVVRNGFHTNGGGLVALGVQRLLVENSSFVGSRATKCGGGMFLEDVTKAELRTVSFFGNEAPSGGGLCVLFKTAQLSAAGSTLAIKTSAFVRNTAEQAGGGVWISFKELAIGVRIQFSSVRIVSNTVRQQKVEIQAPMFGGTRQLAYNDRQLNSSVVPCPSTPIFQRQSANGICLHDNSAHIS